MQAVPLYDKFEINDSIVIIIPKPSLEHKYHHTVSCFQDISQEEEELEDLFDLLKEEQEEEEEDYFYYEDQEELLPYYFSHGVFDYLGLLIKDMVSNLYVEYSSWSSSLWSKINQAVDERDDQFQFYFDM